MPRRTNTVRVPRPRRGVYRARFTRNGHILYYAITSWGELAGEQEADGLRVTEAMAIDLLEDLLAMCDPVPTLHPPGAGDVAGGRAPEPREPSPLRVGGLALLR